MINRLLKLISSITVFMLITFIIGHTLYVKGQLPIQPITNDPIWAIVLGKIMYGSFTLPYIGIIVIGIYIVISIFK